MEDKQVIPADWTSDEIRAANQDIDERIAVIAGGTYYGRCRVHDNRAISHGGAHADHECPAIPTTAAAIARLRTPVTGNKQVTMIRGLVRAAELMERDENAHANGGKIWDDACRVALEIARDYGWGKNQVGSLPMQPPPDFQKELRALLNVYSQENASHTPDFILASYLQACLDTWNLHTRERDRWFGNRSLRGPGADDGAFPPVPASEKSLLP